MLDESNPPFSTCIRCATCDGFPCLVHAKSDAEVLGVRPALEHSNVTLLTNAKVARSTPTARVRPSQRSSSIGRARRSDSRRMSSWSPAGRPTRPSCFWVGDEKHPNGLANGSDQVGRNYMFHDSTAVLALSREENATAYQKTPGSTTSTSARTTSSTRSGTCRWSVSRRRRCSAASDRGIRSLRPSGRSSGWHVTPSISGCRPRISAAGESGDVNDDGNITLTYTETNLEPKKRLYAKVKSILGELDMNPDHLIHRFAYMKNDIPIAGCAHQAGTARFGTDPSASVVDVNCKAHELDNLYVVDTSVFPSIGAVNPALTRWRTRSASATTCSSGSRSFGEHRLGGDADGAKGRLCGGHGAGHRARHLPGGEHDPHRSLRVRRGYMGLSATVEVKE